MSRVTVDPWGSVAIADAESFVAHRASIDGVAKSIGIAVVNVTPGSVELSLVPRDDMINGHSVLHGGFTYLFADTCFAYTCEAVARPSFTRQASIDYISPARSGIQLRSVGVIRSVYGRNTIVDVRVCDAEGTHIAEFRGYGSLIDAARSRP